MSETGPNRKPGQAEPELSCMERITGLLFQATYAGWRFTADPKPNDQIAFDLFPPTQLQPSDINTALRSLPIAEDYGQQTLLEGWRLNQNQITRQPEISYVGPADERLEIIISALFNLITPDSV